jgi:caffeoyl-CoA O-methyltransferase
MSPWRTVAALLLTAAFLHAAANAQPGGERRRPPRWGSAPSPEVKTLARNDAEKKILAVIDELEGQRRGNMNVPREDGRLIRLFTETVGARTAVELGTSNGYSGLWFCLALRDTGGKLITHEIDPRRAKLAREHFRRAGVENMITLVEGDAHEKVKDLKGPIDVVFIDADKEGYLDYLNRLLPLVRPGGVILAHNMSRPAPDPAFVKAITTNPELETVFLNMTGAGMAVSLKKRAAPEASAEKPADRARSNDL